MAARAPNESDYLQVDYTHPFFIAGSEPISPPRFVAPILPTRFPCVRLPGPGPQTFVDPGHYQMHTCLKIHDMVHVQNSPPNLLISGVPTIIIGMGVSHAPGNPNGPSIAVVVHSRTWPEISEYRAFSCTKPPKVDMIDSLYKPVPGDDGETKDVGIMREVLQDFEENTGVGDPKHIIIFRYGVNVSESHLKQLFEAELDQISEACQFFYHGRSPKFAAIYFLELEASENLRSTNDAISYFSKIGGSVTATKIVKNQTGFSSDELKGLGDSLSYLNEMYTQAISLIADVCGPPESPKLEEPEAKRVKARKELDEDELKSERELINNGDELALYVLGKLNAEKGGKYMLEKFLDWGCGTFWKKPSSKGKIWSHVSMYVQELNGENVCRKIIFAELCYSDGKYEPVNVTILDPDKPEEIRYGCGFCFRGYAGEHKSPHPADPSAYNMGHWPYSYGTIDNQRTNPSGWIPESYPYPC